MFGNLFYAAFALVSAAALGFGEKLQNGTGTWMPLNNLLKLETNEISSTGSLKSGVLSGVPIPMLWPLNVPPHTATARDLSSAINKQLTGSEKANTLTSKLIWSLTEKDLENLSKILKPSADISNLVREQILASPSPPEIFSPNSLENDVNVVSSREDRSPELQARQPQMFGSGYGVSQGPFSNNQQGGVGGGTFLNGQQGTNMNSATFLGGQPGMNVGVFPRGEQQNSYYSNTNQQQVSGGYGSLAQSLNGQQQQYGGIQGQQFQSVAGYAQTQIGPGLLYSGAGSSGSQGNGILSDLQYPGCNK